MNIFKLAFIKMEIQEILYQSYINLENERTVLTDKCEEIEISDSKFKEAIEDTKNRLEVTLTKGKCSSLLINQIARHRLNIGEKINNKIEFYNASEILDIIGFLESEKIEFDNFNRNILNGFSKVHHGTYSGIGYSVVRNIKEYWFKKGKIRQERKIEYQKIVEEYGHSGIKSIANVMHLSAMGNKKLKGEWIIFKQNQGKNYYLCLASHSETDEDIFENKINRSLIEFPELIKNESS